MNLTGFKPFSKNTLRGFATVELAIGLIITDIPVHAKGDRSYALLPSKPQLDGDVIRRIDGKPQYAAIIRWNSRERSDKFSDALVQLINDAHPGVLDA